MENMVWMMGRNMKDMVNMNIITGTGTIRTITR